MKLLYISGYHETLEYNDLSLFTEMGIDWFSTGKYKDTSEQLTSKSWRPSITKETDQELLQEFNRLNPNQQQYGRVQLSKEFVDKFDMILCSFCFLRQDMLDLIWPHCKHKPLAFLTYSQQFSNFEVRLQEYRSKGVKLVRGSPRESTIDNYAGEDAIIRCYVDENVFSKWTGGNSKVLSFSNDFPARINHPNFNCYRAYNRVIQQKLPCSLFGNQTEPAGGGGFIPFEKHLEEYKNCSCYFSIGSPPATVTYNFLEAWMTGAPVLTFGSKIGNGVDYNTHEPPFLIENDVDGFYSDDLAELILTANTLLLDQNLAKKVGDAGRKKCLSIFGKEVVKTSWEVFFKSLGVY